MAKFLIVVVLLITGFKNTSAHYLLDSSICRIAKLALPNDETSKQEKQEEVKCKKDKEDIIVLDSFINPFLNISIIGQKDSWQQDAYRAFIISSNTPPPDII